MLQKTARMAAIMGRSSLRPLASSLPGQSGLVLGSSRKHGYATSPAAGPAEVQSQTPIHSTPEPAVKASKLTSLGSVSWAGLSSSSFPHLSQSPQDWAWSGRRSRTLRTGSREVLDMLTPLSRLPRLKLPGRHFPARSKSASTANCKSYKRRTGRSSRSMKRRLVS